LNTTVLDNSQRQWQRLEKKLEEFS